MCPNNTAFHPIPSSQGNREPNPDQRLEQRRNDRTATFSHLFQNRLSQADLPCSHYCREISERWHLRHEDNATDILSPESCSIRIWSCAASISELKRAWICLPSAKRARVFNQKFTRGGTVSRILSWTVIHLGPRLPEGSCCQPVPPGQDTPCAAPIWHCSRWGLPCRSGCPSRGGLLPHLFTLALQRGGPFSVALSLGLPRPGVTRHRCLVESGLSSRS